MIRESFCRGIRSFVRFMTSRYRKAITAWTGIAAFIWLHASEQSLRSANPINYRFTEEVKVQLVSLINRHATSSPSFVLRRSSICVTFDIKVSRFFGDVWEALKTVSYSEAIQIRQYSLLRWCWMSSAIIAVFERETRISTLLKRRRSWRQSVKFVGLCFSIWSALMW